MLAAVHATPGLTRAEASRLLGIGSGAATEVVGRLVAERLVTEGATTPGGGRGRPTRPLIAHPEGPVVLAAIITHEAWRVDAVELGNHALAGVAGRHTGDPATAGLADLARAVGDLRNRFGGRVRGLRLGGPGIVLDGRSLAAPGQARTDVDLAT